MRKLTHQEIVRRQNAKNSNKKLPFVVILNNIRSLHNVGSIFRTCDGVGVEKLYLCGITGYPPNGQIAKTALGADLRVPWEYQREAMDVVSALKQQGYQIVLLEQIDGSIDHDAFIPKKPVCLVVGHEVMGVDARLLDASDCAVEIEMAGSKNSLNVSVAFGVIAYHIRRFLK